MNLAFNLATILSQLFILCFPFLLLSAYSSSHHNVACPFSLVTTCFTFFSSSTSSYSKFLSMNLTQSNNYSMPRFPSYMGTSILALPPNLATSLNKSSSVASPLAASSTSTSSLFASLTSPASRALLYDSSIVSNLARSSRI
jgi:hypothetical protein